MRARLAEPTAPLLTNGEEIDVDGTPTAYKPLAYCNGEIWVMLLNGTFGGTLLTFREDVLWERPRRPL